MTPLEQFEEIKGEVAELQKELSRAEGANEQLLKALQEEDGCSTLEQAKQQYVNLTNETKAAKTAYEKALQEYKDVRAKRIET